MVRAYATIESTMSDATQEHSYEGELRALRKECLLAGYGRDLLAAAAYYAIDDKKERRRSTRDLERFFFQLVRVFDPQLFVEAGAKDASTSVRARQWVGKATRIVAFEANPYTHRRFAGSADFDAAKVEYKHLALSNEPGEVTFKVQRDADGKPLANGKGSLLVQRDLVAGAEEVTVPSTTLDGFFEDFDFEKCCMWVDVEGASASVLGGGPRVLDRAAAIFIEVEDRPVWEGQWLRPDVESHLFDHGLHPVARDFQSRYLYNMVFVREELLNIDRYRWAIASWHSEAARAAR